MATAGRTDFAHASRHVSSEILDRLPPQNLDAERGVLGSLLLDPELCDEVALMLRPGDFYADAHQKLFHHIMEMHGGGGRVDATLLLERLRQSGDLEAIGGTAFLAEVVQSVAVAAHATYYAEYRSRQGDASFAHPRQHRDSARCLRPDLQPSRAGGPGGREDLCRARRTQLGQAGEHARRDG